METQIPPAPNPYATPASDPLPLEIQGGELTLATLGERFLGSLLDGLISLALLLPLWGVLFATEFIDSFSQIGQMGLIPTLLISLVAFAAFIAIQWRFLQATGQTIGKKVMKTRIATLSGEKPPIMDLVAKRYAVMQLLGVVPFVGTLFSLVNVLFVFRKDRRCIHDLIAGTQVVKTDIRF